MDPLRVLIVSENISMKMGGESSLPFYYGKLFSARGVQVWLACHERVKEEVVAGRAGDHSVQTARRVRRTRIVSQAHEQLTSSTGLAAIWNCSRKSKTSPTRPKRRAC